MFKPQPRSLEQNAKLWAILRDVAQQVPWPVNGALVTLSAEDWKDIFTASLTKHHRMASGIDGGFVILGMRTSRMTKEQLGELVELIYAFGAEHEVKWSDEP